MSKYRELSEDEIYDFTTKNRDWRKDGSKLKADFKLSDFKSAMAVVDAVAKVAEEMGHHPTWSNEYNKLSFILSTHDAGGRITEVDTKLAEKISAEVGNSGVISASLNSSLHFKV